VKETGNKCNDAYQTRRKRAAQRLSKASDLHFGTRLFLKRRTYHSGSDALPGAHLSQSLGPANGIDLRYPWERRHRRGALR
jgi:hypothetical protein